MFTSLPQRGSATCTAHLLIPDILCDTLLCAANTMLGSWETILSQKEIVAAFIGGSINYKFTLTNV